MKVYLLQNYEKKKKSPVVSQDWGREGGREECMGVFW